MEKIDEKNLKKVAGGLDTKLKFDFQNKKENNSIVDNEDLNKYNEKSE